VTDQSATDQPTTDESDEEVEAVQAESAVEPELEAVEAVATPVAAASANQGAAPTATAVLTHVVRSIVDDADAVQVDAVEGRNRLKLEVKVGPGDLGRVIGRRGRTAQSIRTVVRAAATRDGVEVDVDFVD
jgi:uncharacterized protein